MILLTDYTSKITSEHSGKPNFMAMVSLALQAFVDLQNQLESLPAKLDADTAVGDQLDMVGEWAGLSRMLSVPISDVYFSFDIPGLGFDEGIWFVSGDPEEGIIELDDITYRQMVKAKIASNNWDGSLGDANTRLLDAFPGADVQLRDNFDMTETFIIAGTPPSKLFQQLVQEGYLEFRPAGVNIV